MTNSPPRNRTQFTVSWPIQGVAYFRSLQSELVLSDVYWQWIFHALAGNRDNGKRLPFVETVESGFPDPSNLVETIPVTPGFLEFVRQVDPTKAPSFELLIPTEGYRVPTSEQLLVEFERVIAEALPSGVMEMEIE
jgi:hypothetical protein